MPYASLSHLRAIAAVDLVGARQVGLVDGAVGALQQLDRLVQQPLDLLVRVLLRVVVEAELRLVDRFLDDDLAMQVGRAPASPTP